MLNETPIKSRKSRLVSTFSSPLLQEPLIVEGEEQQQQQQSQRHDGDEEDDHIDVSKLHRWSIVRKFQQKVQRIPPKYRCAFIIFWIGWKIVFTIAMLVLFADKTTTTTIGASGSSSSSTTIGIPLTGTVIPKTRILYIVTTLAEYNSGQRATTKDQDRLNEVLLPTLIDSVQTMVMSPFQYHVDVYLICAYTLRPEREEYIRRSLPGGVGLQIWDNAAPLGYEAKHSPNKVIDVTRTLARQHRYVIRDKFPYYDMFLAFEDDMRITGYHVEHFMTMSTNIRQLYAVAPTRDQMEESLDHLEDYHKTKFYGDMSREQLARVIPGFVRVEVLLNETANGAQTEVLPIEMDYNFPEHPGQETHIDPRICCHVNMPPVAEIPATPEATRAVIWETNIKGFSLRQLPPPAAQGTSSLLDWVVLMIGPGKNMDPAELVGGYWSGREGAFGDEPRPSGGSPRMIAQQGGWMLTWDQIFRMHTELCSGSFLPPFDPPFSADGQAGMNVEFWSGSYQIFTGVKGGCNMQRIMSFHPDHFSKHFIYHVANNKQRQLFHNRMLRADHLFGQLNTVLKMAQLAKNRIE